MDEFIDLAEQSGMSREQGQAVASGLFAMLQEEIEPSQYQQIRREIPEFDDMAQQHREMTGYTDRSLGSSIVSMITKQNSQGKNGGLEYLITTMKKHKIAIATLIIFIPLALWLLKRRYGIDVFHLFGNASSSSTGTSTTNKKNTATTTTTTALSSSMSSGSPSSSLSGTDAYYNQLFASNLQNGGSNNNNNFNDGRSAAPVVVASYDVVTPVNPYGQPPQQQPWSPSNSMTTPYNSYAPTYPPAANTSSSYNANNNAANNVYVPSFPAGNNNNNNNQDRSGQYQSDGRVYVPSYPNSQNSGNNGASNVYQPQYPGNNGGYNSNPY